MPLVDRMLLGLHLETFSGLQVMKPWATCYSSQPFLTDIPSSQQILPLLHTKGQ